MTCIARLFLDCLYSDLFAVFFIFFLLWFMAVMACIALDNMRRR